MSIGKYRIAAVAVLLSAASLLTLYFHVLLETGTVVSHTFYVPIVLAAVWWKRKGLVVAFFSAAFLIFSNIFLRPDVATVNDYFRACLLVAVALVAVVLSEHIAKRAQKALRESEGRFRSLVESTSDWIWEVDESGVYTYASPKVKELLGYEPEEIIGKTPFDLMPADEAKRVAAEFRAVMDARKDFDRLENTNLHKEGYPVVLETSGVPIFDNKGNFRGYRGIDRDITERKKAQEQLEILNAELKRHTRELEQSNRDLEQFAHVASHDLQEPLRVVASFTQLLERRCKDNLDSDVREYMDYIVDGATRMQQLINDLLVFSRVRARGRPLEPADCNAVLGQAIANLGRAIQENQAVITNDELPTVRVDASQIARLFQNLIGNAIKFRSGENPCVHVSAKKEGDQWVFSVRDNGIGIESQYHERIFEIFRRLHGREEYPGTGIGLALCRRIAERHDGRIWVESQEGKGSTFCFTLPVDGGVEE